MVWSWKLASFNDVGQKDDAKYLNTKRLKKKKIYLGELAAILYSIWSTVLNTSPSYPIREFKIYKIHHFTNLIFWLKQPSSDKLKAYSAH